MVIGRFDKAKLRIDETVQKEGVEVWHCEACNVFHVRAGDVVLGFSRDEFAEFVNETWNCFYDKEFSSAPVN